MGALGSFLTGTVAGVVALGVASWLIATRCDGESKDSEQEEK